MADYKKENKPKYWISEKEIQNFWEKFQHKAGSI